MEENDLILNVYLKVCHQHIMSQSGPVDLNFQSVKFILDLMEIEDQKGVFDRVYSLYKKMLGMHYEKAQLKKGGN